MKAFTTVQGEVMLVLSHEEAERVASVAAHARRYYDTQMTGYATLTALYEMISPQVRKLKPRERSSEELFSALEARRLTPAAGGIWGSAAGGIWGRIDLTRIKWEAW